MSSKKKRSESRREAYARSVFERHSGMAPVLFDDGSLPSMVDYQIFPTLDDRDNPIAVLEIGSITSEAFHRNFAGYRSRAENGFTFPAVSGDWAVMCWHKTSFTDLREMLESLLTDLERLGRGSLSTYDDANLAADPDLGPLLEQMNKNHVVQVCRRSKSGGQPQIAVSMMWGGTSNTAPETTLVMIEDFLSGSSKDAIGIRKKLESRRDVETRILYLQLDDYPVEGNDPHPNSDVNFAGPIKARLNPTRPANLPDCIDELWVVTQHGDGWRWSRRLGWSGIGALT